MSIEVEHLSFSYGTHAVLRDISFCAGEGELLSVLGPNGVGKSTLFRCMLAQLQPESGRCCIGGTDVRQMTVRELARQIAYIPQSHSPVFNYTVHDMVLMGTTTQMGSFSCPRQAQIDAADAAIDRLGIGFLKDRGYRNISGGERQLVLIARAMAQQARILIMDEPSSSLDFGNRIRVMQTLRSLVADGYTVIQSTHDPDQAYRYSDNILALHEGRALDWGPPQKILRDDLMSRLYGLDITVCNLQEDSVRVCIPKDINFN